MRRGERVSEVSGTAAAQEAGKGRRRTQGHLSLEGTQPVRCPGARRASPRTPAEGGRDAAVRCEQPALLLSLPDPSSAGRPAAGKATMARDLPGGHFL